jgi:glycine/D-amino acid oxidase-like deaminating enzyme
MSDATTAEHRSYWHATAAPLVPADALPDAADVVVVGGGMLGCWTAYWLARSGAAVALVERDAIGWGATGRNGGFVTAGLAEGLAAARERVGDDAASAVWKLSEAGRDIVRQTVADEQIDCDLRIPGTLGLALNDAELATMHAAGRMLSDRGVAVEVLDRQLVQELIRTPLGPEITGGAYYRDNILLHSSRYLAGIARAARRHGALLCCAAVEGLVSSGDATDVVTSRGTVRARRVVVGVNAWTSALIPALAGYVVPVRGQVIAYEPLPPIFTTGAGCAVTATGEYWQQALDGSIVLGGCRATAPNMDVGVLESTPTPDVLTALERVFPRLFPELTGLRVARGWAGLMAFTSDYLPVADAAPDLPGVWVAGGFCGHGMPFGPRLGQLLAQAATTRTTPAELHPLRINRPTLVPLASATPASA